MFDLSYDFPTFSKASPLSSPENLLSAPTIRSLRSPNSITIMPGLRGELMGFIWQILIGDISDQMCCIIGKHIIYIYTRYYMYVLAANEGITSCSHSLLNVPERYSQDLPRYIKCWVSFSLAVCLTCHQLRGFSYPLVIWHTSSYWTWHTYCWFNHYKWWFSIAIWVCLKIVYPKKPNGFADHYPY